MTHEDLGPLDLESPPDVRAVLEVRCERRATPSKTADRISAASAVDIARLANLRMWDAYAGRFQWEQAREAAAA